MNMFLLELRSKAVVIQNKEKMDLTNTTSQQFIINNNKLKKI